MYFCVMCRWSRPSQKLQRRWTEQEAGSFACSTGMFSVFLQTWWETSTGRRWSYDLTLHVLTIGEVDVFCKISSCPSRYLTRRSLWSGGITTGPLVSDWSAWSVIYNFSFAKTQQGVCTLNPYFSNVSSLVCSFQSIMQQSPWRLWTWAVRRSWKWSIEASRTMRRSGQKKAGRDTTLRLSNRLLALGRGCSEDRVL